MKSKMIVVLPLAATLILALLMGACVTTPVKEIIDATAADDAELRYLEQATPIINNQSENITSFRDKMRLAALDLVLGYQPDTSVMRSLRTEMDGLVTQQTALVAPDGLIEVERLWGLGMQELQVAYDEVIAGLELLDSDRVASAAAHLDQGSQYIDEALLVLLQDPERGLR